MFTRIAPQKVQHSSGYIVQVGSRSSIQYSDNKMRAEIEVDFAPVTGIYPETLVVTGISGEQLVLSEHELEAILQCILKGIAALGINFEVCRKL